jgi:hypothetical protein
MTVILATQEAEIRRIMVQSQSRQIVPQAPISKKPFRKKGWCSGLKCRPRVSSPSTAKKKKKERITV